MSKVTTVSKGLLLQLSRLQPAAASLGFQWQPCHQFHTQGCPLLFKSTQIMFAEPIKKKKRIDPNIVLEKERRKEAKINKEINKLARFAKKLKPIEEIETPLWIKQEEDIRQRESTEVSYEESERRILLQKEWTRYKMKQHKQELMAIQAAQLAQQKALEELRKESEELYQQAIQLDAELIPHNFHGPFLTPPIENYQFPDGEYEDITRKY